MGEVEAARAAVDALGDCPAVPVWPERVTQRQAAAIEASYTARCKAWAEAKSAAWLTLARAQWRETERLGLWAVPAQP